MAAAKEKEAKDLDKIKAIFQSGDYVPFPINHCILEWAHNLGVVDTPPWAGAGEGKYKVNAIVSDDVAEEMKYCGFDIKTNKDGQQFANPKRKEALGAPEVVDTDGNPVDTTKIGNGTIATIHCKCRHYNIGGKESLPIYIEKVVIEDLVVYDGGSGAAVDIF